MWKLDHKEDWAPKNWCFKLELEKTLESPLDSKEIKLVNPKGNQPWILIGRTNVETDAPILWPPDGKSWLTRKDPDAGKDWGQEEKEATEGGMVEWHHQLSGHEFEQPPEIVKDRESWHAAAHGVAKSWTWLRDWINNNKNPYMKNQKQILLQPLQWVKPFALKITYKSEFSFGTEHLNLPMTYSQL